jgi:beta-fructofuranosidase
MYKLYYQFPNTWFGDCMPFGKDGKFYLYHQRDTRKPGPFGEPFGWSLSTTTDFVHYENHGDAIPRGGDDEQDQFIYAGSIFEAEGQYHAMYTGFNRTFAKKGKDPQVLMKAISRDLYHWEKNSEKLVAPQPGYDPEDWRDPFVRWDEERGEYMMILGGRKAGPRVQRGCTVWFTSKDLKNWKFQGDFWAPNLYNMHEMPDLFKMGDWWYLLISEYSKIVYCRSKSLHGPWTAPADDAFDGIDYYAGRTAFDGKRRVLFGWVKTRDTWRDSANWTWGGTFVAHEIYQRPDGTLGCRIPDSVVEAFQTPEVVAKDVALACADGSKELPVAEIRDKFCKFEARIRFNEGTRAFGVRINEDVDVGDAYDFCFSVDENRLTFDKIPGVAANQINNKGLERPIKLAAGKEYLMQVIVDDDIATVYMDGVALNTRMYNATGTTISLYVIQGKLDILEACISSKLIQ